MIARFIAPIFFAFCVAASAQSLFVSGPGLPVGVPIGTPVSLGVSNTGTTGSSFTITTLTNILAGDLIAVTGQAYRNPGGSTFSSVSDTVNGGYTVTPNTGTLVANTAYSLSAAYFCGAAALSSGSTITINMSVASATIMAQAFRVPGILSSGCLDLTTSIVSNTGVTTETATTGTLSKANEIVSGQAIVNNCPAYTEAPGFTTLGTLCSPLILTGDTGTKIVSSTSPVAFSPSWASAQLAGVTAMTFKGH